MVLKSSATQFLKLRRSMRTSTRSSPIQLCHFRNAATMEWHYCFKKLPFAWRPKSL